MTRINVLPTHLLLDQHLMAEYRELPMVAAALRRSLNAKKFPSIPENYTLNAGHVKFFYNKVNYLRKRYSDLVEDLRFRGYNVDPDSREANWNVFDKLPVEEFTPTIEDMKINADRILLRYEDKPAWYKWYGREVENYREILSEFIRINN